MSSIQSLAENKRTPKGAPGQAALPSVFRHQIGERSVPVARRPVLETEEQDLGRRICVRIRGANIREPPSILPISVA